MEYVNARWMQSLHGFLYGIKWIMFHDHLDNFPIPPLGCRPNTKPADHGIPNAHHHWFILLYHAWGPAWIETHWNSIWLSAPSHMASHATLEGPWPHYMTLEVCRDGLWALFFWALTISWSRLLARVWSGPKATPTWDGVTPNPYKLIGLTTIPLVRKKLAYSYHTQYAKGWVAPPLCGTSSIHPSFLSFCVFSCHGPALPCHSIYTLAAHGFVPCAVFLTTKLPAVTQPVSKSPPSWIPRGSNYSHLLITLTPKILY